MLKTYTKVKDSRSNTLIVLAALVAICMVSRLLFIGEYLEGWDSIDFAMGLHDYDIAYYQPHFPGYPVYMFLCWLVHLSTDNDTIALIIPGAVLGSAVLVPLFYLAKRLFSEKVALLTAFIYIVNPLCWLQSEKALSDAVGLFFIILSAQLLFYACTSRTCTLRYLISGSVILGICLGVRLSYFPFIILWLYVLYTLSKSDKGKMTIRYGVFGFVAGISIWLIPLACYTGFTSLMINGFSFTFGHFGDWGGSVVTSQNILSRFLDFMWCVFCNGLGFWCYDTSVFRVLPSIIMGLGIVSYLRHARFDSKTRFITFYMAPYLLWVFFGQNLEKPRHVLPLIPFIIIFVSAGLARLRDSKYSYSSSGFSRYKYFSPYHLFIGILITSMSIISIRLVSTHKNEPVAQIQLLDYVENNYNGPSTRIYCWETKRFFTYYAPLWDARRARNIDDLQYDIGASLVTPEIILSTSKVAGINSIVGSSSAVAEFKNNRYINNPYHKLILYRLRD
ncbi:MAG: ArnT family glycosyltransferase [Candidatus Scalindua sp.]